ncbi:DUF2911 domain-containing protein [Candidatus Sumerlaeota bacterium]|nr:DUF2911 domain-containing protein [Candidatus Sumerlaeota bacterium]
MTAALPGDPQFAPFKVAKNGDKLEGSLTLPLGTFKTDSITAAGPKIAFSFTFDAMGQSQDAQGTVKVAGDTFTGDMALAGGMLSATIEGAKVGTPAEAALKKKIDDQFMQKVGAPTLPIEDAKAFKGEWEFKAESPMGGEMPITMSVMEVDGKASAKIIVPLVGTNTVNKNLKKTEKGLNMAFGFEMAGNPMDINVDIERDGPLVTGLVDVGSGMLQIPLEGVKKGRGLSKMTAGGKNLYVEYGRPSTSGPGYKGMSTVKEGFIWRLGNNEATNLKTDVDLKIGDKTVKAGRYSLWAKKTAAGWNLIFNTEADVWGTKHVASADVAEVPLTAGKTAAPVELLTLEVKGDGSAPGAGVFKLQWGGDEGTTKFQMDLPPPPPPAAPAGGAAKPAGK